MEGITPTFSFTHPRECPPSSVKVLAIVIHSHAAAVPHGAQRKKKSFAFCILNGGAGTLLSSSCQTRHFSTPPRGGNPVIGSPSAWFLLGSPFPSLSRRVSPQEPCPKLLLPYNHFLFVLFSPSILFYFIYFIPRYLFRLQCSTSSLPSSSPPFFSSPNSSSSSTLFSTYSRLLLKL